MELVTIKDLNVGMRAVHSHLKRLEASTIKVGYPEGEPVAPPADIGSNHPPYQKMSEAATVAYINDQERPFLHQGIEKAKNREIRDAYGVAVVNILQQKTDSSGAGALIGEVAAAAVKHEIRDGNHKPITLETRKKKGSSRPLIDTSQMLNSTTFSIEVG